MGDFTQRPPGHRSGPRRIESGAGIPTADLKAGSSPSTAESQPLEPHYPLISASTWRIASIVVFHASSKVIKSLSGIK